MIKSFKLRMLWDIPMTTKKNPYTKNISSVDAQIKFGHVTLIMRLKAALIRSGYFHDHYISFESNRR